MSLRFILVIIEVISIMISNIYPYKFWIEDKVINNKPEMIYSLSVDLNAENIRISNVLSFDKMFGFERTSVMSKRYGANYAINGMFYNIYGMPSGIIIKKGEVISMTSINTPTVIIDKNNKVDIVDLEIVGKIISKDKEVVLKGVNRAVNRNEYVLFNDGYGSNTRVHRKSINYIINNELIEEIVISDKPVKLKKGISVITTVSNEKPIFKVGDKVSVEYEFKGTNLNIVEAFQSGGWLVREGINVSKGYQNYIGYTTAPNPRTLLGITKDNKLILKVIDGRQPEVSLGLSGKESGNIMIEARCDKAVYLDGGASSTMVVGGNVINRPSNEGKERKVAHAILFFIE